MRFKQQHKIPSIIKEIILKIKTLSLNGIYINVSGGAEEYFRKIKENIKQHKFIKNKNFFFAPKKKLVRK